MATTTTTTTNIENRTTLLTTLTTAINVILDKIEGNDLLQFNVAALALIETHPNRAELQRLAKIRHPLTTDAHKRMAWVLNVTHCHYLDSNPARGKDFASWLAKQGYTIDLIRLFEVDEMTDLKACYLVDSKLINKPTTPTTPTTPNIPTIPRVDEGLINFWASCSKSSQSEALAAFKYLEDSGMSDSASIHLAKYILFNKTNIKDFLKIPEA